MENNILNESSAEEYLELKPSNKWVGPVVLIALVILAGVGFFASRAITKPSKSSKLDTKERPIPVMVGTVSEKTVPVQLQAIGNVQPWSTVSITPQAGGIITGVFFKKGQELKKGQLLFTLDDRPQVAAIQQAQGVLAKDIAAVLQARANLVKDVGQVQQARATLGKDKASVKQAEATKAKDQKQARFAQGQNKRYGQLYKDGAISYDSAQQYVTNDGVYVATVRADEEAISNALEVVKGDVVAIKNAQAVVVGDEAAIKNAQAIVESDRGALNAAKVQLSYAKIYAPMSGLAGNVLITQGNVVQANSTTPLVTITKIHPILVSFAIPETNLPLVQKYMENGKLKVSVVFANNNAHPISGNLTFVNNTVDNTTGTIQLIGDFDNNGGRLFPGRYVDTILTLTQKPNATVVPAQAVQNGPNGQFVFVVKPDMTVDNVPVKISSTIDSLDVVDQGLKPGDRVVTDGQANLVPGNKVRIKTAHDSATDSGASPKRKRHHSAQASGDNS